MTEHDVTGIGYEGLDVDGLITRLRLRGVGHVVDVRLTPISRKRGLSKTALKAHLAEVGIAYSHFRALGNPKSNRDGFAETTGAAAELSRERFRSVLKSSEAEEALNAIRKIAETERVSLLCFEAEQGQCHRSLVLEALGSTALISAA